MQEFTSVETVIDPFTQTISISPANTANGRYEDGDVIPPQTSLTQFNKDVVFIGSRTDLVIKIRNADDIKNEDYRPLFFTEV